MKPSFIIRFILTSILLILVCSCQKDSRYERTKNATLTLRVYEGANNYGYPVKVYVHQYDGASQWSVLYDARGGNDWGLEPGYEYKVSVWEHWLKQPPMDGSAVEYEFRRVLSKKEVPLLTLDDIYWGSLW